VTKKIGFSLLASVHIQRVNSCITAVYHATAWYAKTRYWKSATPMELSKSFLRSGKF